MHVDACNLTAFLATFDRVEATMNYQRDNFASMPIDGGTVMPYQSTTLDGRPAVNANTLSGLIIAFAAAMAGQDTAYNEDNISLTMTVDARMMALCRTRRRTKRHLQNSGESWARSQTSNSPATEQRF